MRALAGEDWILRYDGKRAQIDLDRRNGDFILIVDWRQPASVSDRVPIICRMARLQGMNVGKKWRVRCSDSGIYLRGSSNVRSTSGTVIGSGEIRGYRTDENMPAEFAGRSLHSVCR